MKTLARLLIVSTCVAFPLFAGCSSEPVEVVDLNKVLDALVAVLDENGEKGVETTNATVADASNPEVTTNKQIAAIDPAKQDPEKEATFLTRYADKLNEMKVLSSGKVGVSFTQGGEIVGFKDTNENRTQDEGEPKEFTVTIDPANQRLIASDNHGYHRPYGYRPSGLLTGYLLGSMMGRQHSFYSGPMAASRPNYTNTPMSPANYHQSAVSSVRSRVSTSSARVRTGSKGFSFGK